MYVDYDTSTDWTIYHCLYYYFVLLLLFLLNITFICAEWINNHCKHWAMFAPSLKDIDWNVISAIFIVIWVSIYRKIIVHKRIGHRAPKKLPKPFNHKLMICVDVHFVHRWMNIHVYQRMHFTECLKKTDERKSPQEKMPAWENSSLRFIEAFHQW